LEPVYYFDADFTEVFDSLGTGLNSYVDIFWKQSSDGYRLPTEAEWEYAARGATNSPNYLYAGSNDVDEVGWYAVNNLPFGIKSVGQKLPNSLGLYDMSGNVSEWCWDWEGGLFPGSPNNPSGPSGGTSRIFRGGNFGSPATLLEVSSQDFNVPGFRFNYLGFRIARGAIDQALDCVTTLVQPLDNATDVALSTNIAWEAAANATGYRISLGTSPNGTNLVNNEDLGTSLSYNAPGCLPSNTIIYVTIIAYDANGDATGCSGFSFRTRTDATPDMVTIAGGTFQMGCTSEQSDCDNDETPVHSVTLDGFLIGRFEVTQCEWEDVMGNWTFGFSNCGGSCPAEQINYYDVATFCNRLSEQEGLEPVYYIDSNFDTPFDSIVQIPVFPEIEIFWKPGAKGYRMPTEAEWEYAARGLGAAPQTLYSGSNVADEVGWYDANAGSEVHPVGQKQSNAAGLYDMSGNVWERCWDVYDLTYYNSSPINNPTGPANTGQDLWVGRGSSWFNEEEHWLRVANREHFSKITRINSVGFRICRTP
jgi:formylglycine-generating enzyme required for sulfatase activity